MSAAATSSSCGSAAVIREGRWRRRFYPVIMHLVMGTAVFLVTFPLIYAIILSTQSSNLGTLRPGPALVDNFYRRLGKRRLWAS